MDLPGQLAGDAEQLTARRQDSDVRTVANERVGQLGANVDQMLAVVQEKQEVLRTQALGERLKEGNTRDLTDSQGLGYGLGHQQWIGQRGQLDQPDAIGKLIEGG